MTPISEDSFSLDFSQQEYMQNLDKLTADNSRYTWIDGSGHVFNTPTPPFERITTLWNMSKLWLGLSSSEELMQSRAIHFLEYGISNGWVSRSQAKKAITNLNLDNTSLDLTHLKAMVKKIPVTKEEAASTLAAHWKGKITRDVVVLPNQIRAFLEQHIHSKHRADIADISQALCREILEASLKPERFKGISKKITKLTTTYPLMTQTQQRQVRLDFDCWLETSSDGKKIRLRIIPSIDPLGEGGIKKVLASQYLEIDLRLVKGLRHMMYRPEALYQILNQRNMASILQTNSKQRELMQLSGVRLAEVPKVLMGQLGELEMASKWYNSDFAEAMEAGSIPLTFEEHAAQRPITLSDSLKALSDVARTLHILHQHGFIHKDVKGLNVLLEVDVSGQLVGNLADFDFLAQGSHLGDTGTALYQDFNSVNGWITPFADCYGLASILALVLTKSKLNTEELFLDRKFFENSKAKSDVLKKAIEAHMQEFFKKRHPNISTIALGAIVHEKFWEHDRDDRHRILLKALKQVSSDEDRELLKRFEIEIDVLEDSLNLISTIMKQSSDTSDFWRSHPDITQNLSIPGYSLNTWEKLMLQWMQSMQMTSGEFLNKIEGFRQRLEVTR